MTAHRLLRRGWIIIAAFSDSTVSAAGRLLGRKADYCIAATGFPDSALVARDDAVPKALRLAAFLATMPSLALRINLDLMQKIVASMDEHLLLTVGQCRYVHSCIMPVVRRAALQGPVVDRQHLRQASACAFEIHAPRNCANAAACNAADGAQTHELCLQEWYSACGEDEDAISMALTALNGLLQRCCVRSAEVGHLQLSSTSLLDRSKSMKAELMALLEGGGGSAAEGVDAYSGAAALVGCVGWTAEGGGWDGRWTVAVCCESAASNAMDTVAMAFLIGPSMPQDVRQAVINANHLPFRLERERATDLRSVLDSARRISLNPTLRTGQVAHESIVFHAICARHARNHGRYGRVVQHSNAGSSGVYHLQEVASPTADGSAGRRYAFEPVVQLALANALTATHPPSPRHKSLCHAPANGGALAATMQSMLVRTCMCAAPIEVAAPNLDGTLVAPIHGVKQPVDTTAMLRGVTSELLPSASADMPLMEAGLDSLGATEFRNRLSGRLGDTVELPETLVFDFPTLRQLETHVSTTLRPQLVESIAANSLSAPTVLAELLKSRGAPALQVERPPQLFACAVGAASKLPTSADRQSAHSACVGASHNALEQVPSSRWQFTEWQRRGLSGSVASRCRYAAFMTTPELFDNSAFLLSSAETAAMDPQQRLLLELGYMALHRACIDRAHLAGSLTGIFLGSSGSDFGGVLSATPAGRSVYAATGSSSSIASGRLSYVLGLHGPCASYDTACSSALTAYHACHRALQTNESPISLAAGTNLMLSPEPGATFAIAGLTSLRGRSFTWDTRADGYARAEACGTVTLREPAGSAVDTLLVDALGSAVRQDGRSASLTAPNGRAQQGLLAGALHNAQASAGDLILNEAHGTGTALGDPIEAGSFAIAVLSERDTPLAVSGVKANIGHAEPAAGMTGLLKLAMALDTGKAAPNAQLRLLNSHVGGALRGVRCALPAQLSGLCDEVRHGGVSSFGYSGTIAHAVLRQTSKVETAVHPSVCLMYHRHALLWRERDTIPRQHEMSIQTSCIISTSHKVTGTATAWGVTSPLDAIKVGSMSDDVPLRPSSGRKALHASELHLTSPGSVTQLIVRPQALKCYSKRTDNHVEMNVQAAGLNFRDVLNMLDLDPTRTMRPFGLECAAVASSVGDRVAHVSCGDSIYGMALGCLASTARTNAHAQVRMPKSLTFEEACTLPILWCTIRLAGGIMQLRVKNRLLIHATTGGVGSVALEFALRSGALIFSSVGRPSKVAHVRALGATSAASSRDTHTFMHGTGTTLIGWRLHFTLSALSKAFISTSLVLMSHTSRYLEVGKNNIWSEARMGAAVACSPFRLVAADYQSMRWTHHCLAELTTRAGSEVHPLPLVTFTFETAEMIRAFNGACA